MMSFNSVPWTHNRKQIIKPSMNIFKIFSKFSSTICAVNGQAWHLCYPQNKMAEEEGFEPSRRLNPTRSPIEPLNQTWVLFQNGGRQGSRTLRPPFGSHSISSRARRTDIRLPSKSQCEIQASRPRIGSLRRGRPPSAQQRHPPISNGAWLTDLCARHAAFLPCPYRLHIVRLAPHYPVGIPGTSISRYNTNFSDVKPFFKRNICSP